MLTVCLELSHIKESVEWVLAFSKMRSETVQKSKASDFVISGRWVRMQMLRTLSLVFRKFQCKPSRNHTEIRILLGRSVGS